MAVPVMVAVNCWVPPVESNDEVGEMETVIAGGGATLTEKLMPAEFAPLMVADWTMGLNVYPLLLGVTE